MDDELILTSFGFNTSYEPDYGFGEGSHYYSGNGFGTSFIPSNGPSGGDDE